MSFNGNKRRLSAYKASDDYQSTGRLMIDRQSVNTPPDACRLTLQTTINGQTRVFYAPNGSLGVMPTNVAISPTAIGHMPNVCSHFLMETRYMQPNRLFFLWFWGVLSKARKLHSARP